MESLTIADLKQRTSETPVQAGFDAQLQQRSEKTTRKGDPYLELTLTDATASFTLKAWSNHPQFLEVNKLRPGAFVHLEGAWTQSQYGIDSDGWKFRALNDAEVSTFLAGDPDTKARQDKDWDHIMTACAAIRDPRLQALSRKFLAEFGDRFRRAAAAKRNHHARRGGLVEHVAQMMRSAAAICTVYTDLNTDLLITGVLFHDCGKLWENNYPEAGFAQTLSLHGEMMGHIPLGIELVNKLWRDLIDSEVANGWLALDPPSEHVRLHLLHLIASHHGELAFGSPTLPRTPEAFALHHVDNLDAKSEMIRCAYLNATEPAPGIFDRQFPLPANLVSPLPDFDDGTPPDTQREEKSEGPGTLL
ncbi:MAG: HD domain-containing protein [Roseibacillus sp.]|nr:HD domain-containing protein [Roseibacillus sp.]